MFSLQWTLKCDHQCLLLNTVESALRPPTQIAVHNRILTGPTDVYCWSPYHLDRGHQSLLLVSTSSEVQPPIYIAEHKRNWIALINSYWYTSFDGCFTFHKSHCYLSPQEAACSCVKITTADAGRPLHKTKHMNILIQTLLLAALAINRCSLGQSILDGNNIDGYPQIHCWRQRLAIVL